MVAQLNAYRRAKDQSEARVRELAAELAEAAKDSRAWRSQARRVADGVADAKGALAREASTPRLGGDALGDGDAFSDSSVSDGGDDNDELACEGGRKNADDHPVFRRVRHGRVADVAALVRARRVDPDVRDRFRNTPLIVAAQNDRKRISVLLVKAGANLNAANARGNAALHYCYAYGHFDLAEFLERRGADVSVRNEAGVAPRDVLEGDADANARWCAAKRDAEALRVAKVRARAAFRTQETAKINLDAVRRELKASKLVAAGIASEAQFGQKTTLDLLDAEQDVNDAELRLVTATHNLRLAAYRLQAAIGGLTASSMGLGDVLGALDDMPIPNDPFSTTFPFSRRTVE